jgi:hypothetical protein
MWKIITPFIVVTTSIVVGLYAYVGSLSQLMADDFCSVYFAEKLGTLRSVWYWYITWHGGFSASFADALLSFLGQTGLRFVVPIVLVAWFISLTWSIASALHNFGLGRQVAFSVSAALLVLYGTLMLSPATSASIIWWGGLRGYIPPLILMLLYVAFYGEFLHHEWSVWQRYLWYAASFSLVLISGGFSEPFTPLQIVIIIFLLVEEWYTGHEQSKYPRFSFLIAGMLGGIIALLIMIMAPGNAVRQTFFPPPPSVLDIVSIALKSYIRFLLGFFLQFQKIAALLGIVSGSFLLGTFLPVTKRLSSKTLLAVVVTGFLLAYGCFLPAAYGQSTGPSDTSLIIPVYILMLTITAAGVIGGGFFAHMPGTIRPQRHILVLSLILLLSLGYSTILNTRSLILEARFASAYAEKWAIRDQQIRRAKNKGLKEISVPALPHWITEEPTDNPKFFVNKCMSLYYGIDIIATDISSK